MSDLPVGLTPPPAGYADWLADLKGRSTLPSIEQIERELAGNDASMEDDSQ